MTLSDALFVGLGWIGVWGEIYRDLILEDDTFIWQESKRLSQTSLKDEVEATEPYRVVLSRRTK